MASKNCLSSNAAAWLDRIKGRHFIDGQMIVPVSGEHINVDFPGTGAVFTQIAAGTAPDIDAAVLVARRAFKQWARMDPSARGRILWEWARLIRTNSEVLAELEVWDSGKPIVEARMDMTGTADILEYYAGLATKIYGQTQPLPGNQLGVILREPTGVAGLITPWNYPLYVATWKSAPALCCGCTVVHKPSELTSITALVAAHLAIEAGMPAGVYNVVTGYGAEAGAALSAHPGVDVLGFTGGPVSGRIVLKARAELLRYTQMELGGKSPNIIFDDADLDLAAAGAAFGIFFNQGENCNAGSRILVHEAVHDQFLDKLKKITENIRVGPPMDETTQMGALISAAHLSKVEAFVEHAKTENVRVVTGGKRLTGEAYKDGFYYAPTVLADVEPSHRVFREEVFGPVVTVTKFSNDDEAIEFANATDYGLAAGCWTKNVDRALRCVRDIQAGYVWVNTFNNTPVEAPFGGQKGSGFGRDCGMQAIETYTTWKTACWTMSPFEPYYK